MSIKKLFANGIAPVATTTPTTPTKRAKKSKRVTEFQRLKSMADAQGKEFVWLGSQLPEAWNQKGWAKRLGGKLTGHTLKLKD